MPISRYSIISKLFGDFQFTFSHFILRTAAYFDYVITADTDFSVATLHFVYIYNPRFRVSNWKLLEHVTHLSLCSKHIRSLGILSFLDISFFKFSTLSVFATWRSNWPPVVGVTRTVMVVPEVQPHPECWEVSEVEFGFVFAASDDPAFPPPVSILLASPKHTTTHSNTERLRKLNCSPRTLLIPYTSTHSDFQLATKCWYVGEWLPQQPRIRASSNSLNPAPGSEYVKNYKTLEFCSIYRTVYELNKWQYTLNR